MTYQSGSNAQAKDYRGDGAFGAAFLKHPDLFPARSCGDPWGSDELSVCLAGDTYHFKGFTPAQKTNLTKRYDAWLTKHAPQHPVEVSVYRAAGDEFRDIDTRGWQYTLDLDQRAASIQVAGLRFMARIECEPRLSAALWITDPTSPLSCGSAPP